MHLKCIIASGDFHDTTQSRTLIKQALKEFPSVVLNGPRQAGKTTLIKNLYENRYRYITLEDPDTRLTANNDPRSFLSFNKPPVIYDEIQYAPNLMPYIKQYIDDHRDVPGQFILSGSQNLLLNQHISESLAGRAAILKLMPLTLREIYQRPQEKLVWQRFNKIKNKHPIYQELWENLIRGSFPELNRDPQRNIQTWYASYLQTYLERDVRTLRQIGDLTQFQIFLRALAAYNGQLLNMAELARELGIVINTIKAWISILEATFQIIILRPYYQNIGKRLVKMPKIYFTDVGLLCHIIGFRDPIQAASSTFNGMLMETAVITEIYKSLLHQGIEPRLYFWRTASGNEIDLVVEYDRELIPIEIKHSATPDVKMARHIKSFQEDFPDRVKRGYVIHPGDVQLPLGKDIIALPLADL